MFYITQIIYIQPNQEEIFNQFEALTIPIISKYNGKLLLRIRPDEKSIIEQNIPSPYEIHLVSFETEQDFENFKQDETRKSFMHLKEKAIQSVLTLQGKAI